MVSAASQQMSDADHDLVTTAIAAAEAISDGEIATIVAARSDDYADWALGWALIAALGWLAAIALWPTRFTNIVNHALGGWQAGLTNGELLAAALIGQVALFVMVRAALMWLPLRLLLVPGPIKTRRARVAAIRAFRIGTQARTRAATGVLIYLSLGEHRAEIVADASIHQHVPQDRWGDAMAALVGEVRAGRPGAGIAGAVTAVGAIIAEHFPRSPDDRNELPDRLIEL